MIYYIRDEEGSLIGLKHNDEIYYYVKNMQEDIIGITDSNNNLLCSYLYDSWGNIISIKDNDGNIINDTSHIGIINPYRYRSYYYDKETKLYYLNSRYYNPEWGRFINCDIGISKDSIDGLNLYVYALNNPIVHSDVDGEWPKWIKTAAKIAVGVAVIGACVAAVAITGGASAGVAGYIAAGALKGSIIGGTIGTAAGAATSVVKNRVKTGSWKGSGKAAVKGAVNGFASGTVTGAISGVVDRSVKVANAAKNWNGGSFGSGYDSMNYHYNKHGNEITHNNIVNYTNDALDFMNRNQDVLQYSVPSRSTMQPGFTSPYPKGHMGGWFTGDGKILTFWYR